MVLSVVTRVICEWQWTYKNLTRAFHSNLRDHINDFLGYRIVEYTSGAVGEGQWLGLGGGYE